MSRPAIARCINCHCSDERRCVYGCLWAKVSRFARVGICDRCYADEAARPKLIERYELAITKSKATVGVL
jgi:hypothetical protein